MKAFLPKCLPVAFSFLFVISACKKSDQPVANEEMTWKAIPMPADAMMDTGMSYTLSLPPSGMVYLTCSDHIFSSDDAGATWNESFYPVNYFPNGDTVSGVLSIAPNGVLYSSASVTWGGGAQSALLRSFNGGMSWGIVQIPGANGSNAAIGTPAFGSNGAVYLAVANSIYVSGDNGSTWAAILTISVGNSISSVAAAPDGALYAAIPGIGVLRSGNNGTAWDTVNTGLPSFAATTAPNILGISPAGVVYLEMPSANLDSATAGSGLYYSNNGGALWHQSNSGLPTNATVQAIHFLKNNSVLATTANACYISADGVSWSTYDLSMPTDEYRVMGVDAQQNLYIGDNDGLYKTVQPID
ncbi:MAG TPA: sialidase family protein [Candidatus Kapabacteria bacterium]|nr:sialidase family protein [Candidatus Kapabacteria bacterium]